MIPRLSGGWQTTMADLALILFIVTAAGLRAEGEKQEPLPALPVSGEPLAIYKEGEGAPPLSEWLAEQAPDGRQQLSLIVRYPEGRADEAARKALELVNRAGPPGKSARIILEEGERAEALAVLAYDRPQEQMARTLQQDRQE